jgi:hypothetical protein
MLRIVKDTENPSIKYILVIIVKFGHLFLNVTNFSLYLKLNKVKY